MTDFGCEVPSRKLFTPTAKNAIFGTFWHPFGTPQRSRTIVWKQTQRGRKRPAANLDNEAEQFGPKVGPWGGDLLGLGPQPESQVPECLEPLLGFWGSGILENQSQIQGTLNNAINKQNIQQNSTPSDVNSHLKGQPS